MKTLLLILLFLSAPSGAATTPPTRAVCILEIAFLTHHGFRPNTEIIEQQLAALGFSKSPAINRLQAIHVARFQSGETKFRVFNPNAWALKDKESIDILLGDPSGRMLVTENGQFQPASIEAFVDQWETDFVRFGGVLGAKWKQFDSDHQLVSQAGRDRFLRNVILESAFLFQVETGKIYPFSFAPNNEHSVTHVSDLIARYFTDTQTFLAEYDQLVRRRQRIPISLQSLPYSPALRAAALQLKKKGVCVRTFGEKPLVRQHLADVERTQILRDVVDLALAEGQPRLPFTLFIQETTDGSADSQTSFRLSEISERIEKLFGNFDQFVSEANAQIGWDFFLVPEGRTAEQQLLIEVGTLVAKQNYATKERFPGFTIGATIPEYHLTNEFRALLAHAKIQLPAFNDAVRALLD